jgi:hypothetical protein
MLKDDHSSVELSELIANQHSLTLDCCSRHKHRRLYFPHVDCWLKIVDEGLLALDATVGQLTDLLRIEALPILTIQVLVQRNNINWVTHVDEGIADVTVVLQVNRKIEKIVTTCMFRVDSLQQHFLCVLVGDILDHYSRTLIMPLNYCF